LEKVFEDQRKIECISIQDISNKELLKNQTLFINREKINKKDNLFVTANEYDWNLQSIIRNTKNSDTKIVLIIDESHRTAKTDKSQELIKLI
jgi:type III restriction enzyme